MCSRIAVQGFAQDDASPQQRGVFVRGKLGIMVRITLKKNNPLSGTYLIIGKKLMVEPFLPRDQAVRKKKVMKSPVMEENVTLIM